MTLALRAAAIFATLLLPSFAQEDESPVRAPLPSPAEIAKLPPDGGDEFNRLVFEQSPYLLQHARNPVDWYPWGPEAFAAARKEDKPVFLSVGYSTCHWCHVMEHESFENEDVARLMNDAFICVKVDREERPDIDQIYMTVTQAMTGRGGWPMTVIMTADKEPFFAGTYFPRESKFQRIGMLELVPKISKAWQDEREQIVAHAKQTTSVLAARSSGTAGEALDADTLAAAFQRLSGSFDLVHGGFGEAPKFPVPHNLRFLLRQHQRSGDPQALLMVEKTLSAWRRGGIFDQVGFGFHRYSTDPVWLLPHFEKMLYDQALMAMAYVEAWQTTGTPEFRETAELVFEYVLRDMTDPRGGFYSAEDADSEGEEGLFYLWKPEELVEVLGEPDARIAQKVFEVVPGGNFKDQSTGQKTGDSILHLATEIDDHARDLKLEPSELRAKLESIRVRLFQNREARIHPLKDDKILTDWNGLMIAALAKAGSAFGEPRYTQAAKRAADFVLSELRTEEGRLLKRYRGGQAAFHGLLEDYAFFVWGLLELYEAGFDVRYLEEAVALNALMIQHFHDDEKGGFFTAPDDGEKLIVRSKELYDGALPSGNSVAALNLLRLSRITANEDLETLAARLMTAFSGDVARGPEHYSQLLIALDFALGPSHEIVIAGAQGTEDVQAMLRALRRPFIPNKVVLFRPEGEAEPALTRVAAYTANQTALSGKATAYVCQNFVCDAPTTEVETMLESIRATDD